MMRAPMESEAPRPPHRRKGIYLLPNLITTGGVVCRVSMRSWPRSTSNFERAGMAVFVAMVFDGLDGRIARWTQHRELVRQRIRQPCRTWSSFGRRAGDRHLSVGRGARIAEYGLTWGRVGWLAGVLLRRGRCAAARALQCARRGGQALLRGPAQSLGGRDRRAAFVWFSGEWREPGLVGLIVAFVVTMAAGALMVSRFRYSSFKDVDLGERHTVSLFAPGAARASC